MKIQDITTCPNPLNGIYNPTAEQKHAAGYRVMPDHPPLALGYTRISITAIEGDGINGAWQVVDRLTSEIEAEQAAAEAEAARLASLPAQFGSGVAVLNAEGHWLELVPVGDAVVPIQVSNSPLNPDTRDAMKADGVLKWEQHRQRIAAIENDLLTIDTAVDEMTAIDLSATGAVGVAIAATTGANKAALTAIRNAMIDVRAKAKKGMNNARQACEKLRKEVK